uniref:Granulin n=1 Tax=Rhipicephalus zambeziensis TaxID=60191 RepID=A0A224YU92_9ACAR
MVQKVQPVGRPQAQASMPQVDAELIQCPDGSFCQNTQTCCLLNSGRYGCCPYAHAECCSDHVSCCPEGYRCLVSTQQCIHAASNRTAPMLRKVDSIALESAEQSRPTSDVNNVRCPDGNYCQDGQTCCLLTSGSYGCCPYQHAECCSDHTSCCPEGYRCRISTHQCVHATTNHTVAMVQKVSAFSAEPRQAEVSTNAELLRCPDGSYCQNTQTCCLLVSGHYGCCPYVHAQCCSDHTSCCPEGYRCKVSTKQCIHATSNHSVAAGQKVDAVIPKPTLLSPRSNDVTCPDGHKCLSGQTCCPLSSTRYGCCPLPNAVCCDDDQHCCPEGYTCNAGSGTCELGDRSVPMVQKGPAFVDAALIQAAIRNEICPDGNECDDDQTCCQLRSGSYGCCPYNHAVCCDDKVHCCPEGYTCDTKASRCLNGNLASPLSRIIRKRISRPMNRILVDEVKTTCPDQSTCPDRMTCCKSNNTYSCCPYNEATCCQDGQHCCPKGYDCDEARHMCTRRRRPEDLPWVN